MTKSSELSPEQMRIEGEGTPGSVHESPRTSLPLRFGRSFGIVSTTAGAFVLTCLLLDLVLPARDQPPQIREKLAHMAAHGNEYDALFIGSSRVLNQIMPVVFDRELAGQSLVIKSFNFGVSGMYPPEDAYVLDEILRLKPARLRWVFVELQTLETALPRAKRDTLRKLSWHDWPRFSLLCERFITTRKPTRKHHHWRQRFDEMSGRWPEICDHALLFFRYCTNLGRGNALLNRWVDLEQAPLPDSSLLGKDRDGWLPADLALDDETIVALDAALDKRRRSPPVRDSADPVSRKALALMMTKIQRAGATPILIVPPTPNKSYFFPNPQSEPRLVVLEFANPEKYPELYDAKYHRDPVHLNSAGAEIFTRLLAGRFLEEVEHR